MRLPPTSICISSSCMLYGSGAPICLLLSWSSVLWWWVLLLAHTSRRPTKRPSPSWLSMKQQWGWEGMESLRPYPPTCWCRAMWFSSVRSTGCCLATWCCSQVLLSSFSYCYCYCFYSEEPIPYARLQIPHASPRHASLLDTTFFFLSFVLLGSCVLNESGLTGEHMSIRRACQSS